MSHYIQSRQRPLLPAAPQSPSETIPHNILPRHPRVGVTIACETCRKRKVRELRRQFKQAEMERTQNQNLINLLRSRNHDEANYILDLLRQDTSVRDILRDIEHGDMLCELSLVPETKEV
ncbi:uncharacterized protein QYS62_008660 [Fusarium acuminatum]|uniref:Uncharacterized protein n=1 Tax=Fusarium acuminatum TaxID=5515 RepID=A0ABZ2X648_9HYPO